MTGELDHPGSDQQFTWVHKYFTLEEWSLGNAASLTMMQILTVVELCSLICMVLQSDKLELQDLFVKANFRSGLASIHTLTYIHM